MLYKYQGGPASFGIIPVDTPLGRHIPACTGTDTPLPTATAADGIHPTGMHSCSSLFRDAPNNYRFPTALMVRIVFLLKNL